MLGLLLLLSVSPCFAQDAADAAYLRATRLLNQASNEKLKHQDAKAIRMMEQIMLRYPGYEPVYVALGDIYFNAHEYAKAASVYQRAFYACENGKKNFVRMLATSQLNSGRTAEALNLILLYGNDSPEWDKLEERARRVQLTNAGPGDSVSNMGIRLNRVSSELYPFISPDGESIYFTRRTADGAQDFYRSLRDSCGGWLSGQKMSYPFSTPNDEAAMTVAYDRHYLLFTRCDNRSPNGWALGGCDLLLSYTLPNGEWSPGQSFGSTINTPGFEGMGCLSPNDRELYFVSDRVGGMGGLDIWMSRYEHGYWQEPKNLGPGVNTPGNETAPFLYADNETLYFSSDGHSSLGGTDIFLSRRSSDSTWGDAANLGYPINSTFDEESISLTADGTQAYFSSNRDSLQGNMDIYSASLPAAMRPKPVYFLEGAVLDSLSDNPLNYTSIFVSDDHGRDLAHYTSNKGDGSFLMALPANALNYVYINRVGYAQLVDSISGTDSLRGATVRHDFRLVPSGYQPPVLDTMVVQVNFDRASLAVSDSAKAAVKQLMLPWLEKSAITLAVNGYADRGASMAANEQLSYKRAEIITQLLLEMGFGFDQLTPNGLGNYRDPESGTAGPGSAPGNNRVEIIVRGQ